MPTAQLVLPDAQTSTESFGIFQGDIVLRTALIAAIRDLRAKPWLLDFAFASLPKDQLTAKEYGLGSVKDAKDWFLNTKIPVLLTVQIDENVQLPMVSIAMAASAEQEQEGTLGDVHYVPFDPASGGWDVLAGPFTPTAYVPATGTITLDPAAVGPFQFAPGMVVVASDGRQFPVLDVPETNQLVIQPGTYADLDGMQVKSAEPSLIAEYESTVYRETYAVGCHVDSEPVHLVYLHSIVVFALLRYKQDLLEARGFERTVLNSTDFTRDDSNLPEFLYNRYCQITGTVRQVWPKTVEPQVRAVETEVVATQVGDRTDLLQVSIFTEEE